MTERFTGKVIAIWPQNRKEIKQLNQMLPISIPRFTVSIEHSPTTCDACGRDCWIGPKQKMLLESPFLKANKLCMFCISKAVQQLGLDPQPISTNMDEHLIPRRS